MVSALPGSIVTDLDLDSGGIRPTLRSSTAFNTLWSVESCLAATVSTENPKAAKNSDNLRISNAILFNSVASNGIQAPANRNRKTSPCLQRASCTDFQGTVLKGT